MGLAESHSLWLGELDRCARLAEQPHACEARAPNVSDWSVGDQLEHLLLSDQRILEGIGRVLEASSRGAAPPAEGGPTLIGRLILWTGIVPRGRATAPDSTRPDGMAPGDLVAGFARVQEGVQALRPRLDEIGGVPSTRAHPILGHFTASQWLRFGGVHHRHHGKIIRDIQRAGGHPG